MILPGRVNYAYLYALFGGGLFVLSFPTFDFFPLAWFALAPLLVILYDAQRGDAFKAGLSFGTVYFFGTVYWIYHSINHYGSIPFVPSLLIVLVLSLYLSLYTAFFVLFIRPSSKRPISPSFLLHQCSGLPLNCSDLMPFQDFHGQVSATANIAFLF
jgi:apolipoprotein N-acyltransferase